MLTKQLTQYMQEAFKNAGFDPSYGDVVVSGRPDLCQFQCNGAMPASKVYKLPPFQISDRVIEEFHKLTADEEMIAEAVTIKPGFINITLTASYIANTLNAIAVDERFGVAKNSIPNRLVLDYGGPNIAKPLHVGHLRTAIIGESLKRLFRFLGDTVIADVHLGDWGLQMGMIISEIKRTQPDLPYFDEEFTGSYPTEAPFSLADLEEIYPRVSAKCKEDDAVYALAKETTYHLQQGRPGYIALWKHIVDISIDDIKKNYERLNVDFDLWYGESTSHPFIDPAIQILKDKGVLYESDGALVVDVTHEDDKKELPPIILFKSDGSVIYGTTDLATIYQRVNDFSPSHILYVVDSRQATHFTQVFRCALNHGVCPSDVSLEHIGFGTMNGKDGKPFKTRAGGILKLSDLIEMVENHAKTKILENAKEKEIVLTEDDVNETSHMIGLATLKYADLSNYRMKDYVFDLEKFSSFEGKTGPYILYSTVRIKNIIRKLEAEQFPKSEILAPESEIEKDLMLKIDGFEYALQTSARDRAPNILCEYVYDLATLVSSFYHTHHIINEVDLAKKGSWYSLLKLAHDVIVQGLDLLGILVPEKM